MYAYCMHISNGTNIIIVVVIIAVVVGGGRVSVVVTVVCNTYIWNNEACLRLYMGAVL